MPASSHIRRADRPQLPSNEPASGWVPPEETVWQRYSANGESVISGMTSLLLHLGLLGVLLVGTWAWFGSNAPTDPGIEFLPPGDGEGGGMGNVAANGLRPGVPENTDERRPLDLNEQKRPNVVVPNEDLAVKAPRPQAQNDPLGDAISKKAAGRPELANLGQKLREAAGVLVGPGVHGKSDKRHGAGSVDDDWVGNKRGPGTGPHSRTWDRMQRWEIAFNTDNARHYIEQLDALGAIVTMPDRNDNLMTVRNLKERPAVLERRDLALGRMYWVDDRLESVASVAADLGLSFTPVAIVAFYPKSLEEELVAKEKAAQGLAENEIQYTKFSITFRGGKHVIRVAEQLPKKGKK